MDVEAHEKRMRELDREGIRELFRAAGEYHQKYSKGPGGAAVCVCGAACGGSEACRGLAAVRDFLRYASWGDPGWEERYNFLRECLDR